MSLEKTVSLTNVSVRYGQNIVLDNINLSVNKREIVSIVGPNGGGKTTLLNTILGLKKPFQGEVRVLGADPAKQLSSGQIGFLPQNGLHDRHFPISVFDTVAMARYALTKPGRRLTERDKTIVLRVLEKVEMLAQVKDHFGSLSGGQKHRVLIARALAIEPKILILDEPSTGLDASAQDRFYELLKQLKDKDNLTIILVSHDISTVSAFVDQIACLNKQIHFHGKPEESIPEEALEKMFGKQFHFLIHDENCQTCGKNRG